MQPDPTIPPPVEPPAASTPPPLPVTPGRKPWSAGPVIAIALSLFLELFLADGVVSLADDSLVLFGDSHVLSGARGMLSLFALVLGLLVYGLMALTPMIPKRLFLPLTLFNTFGGLVVLPFMIYCLGRIQQVAWALSFYQVILGLGILYKVQGGFRFRWPLVPESRLNARAFSWRNVWVFLLANVFVLVPVIVIYVAVCASLAVGHFSEGFLSLRPGGLSVQVRKYVRSDGKTIQLVPMSHIGEPEFYRTLAQSFPTNATVLMEGVTDDKGLLTNRITYRKMANTLGVTEQQKEFKPQGRIVRADVDIGIFTTNTINFLNLVMLIQSRGANGETLPKLMQYSEAANFQDELFEDLLGKRNQRLLEEIQTQLAQSDLIIVPWGAGHMPGIARGLQKAGFHVIETQEHMAIRFGSDESKGAGKATVAEAAK